MTACTMTLIAGLGWSLCCPRDTMLAAIDDRSRWHERQMSASLGPAGVVEHWANRITGSYTYLLTLPRGLSCPIGIGRRAPERLG